MVGLWSGGDQMALHPWGALKMLLTMTAIWPISFLFAAVVDDLIYKKFHNWLFMALSGLGFVYLFTLAPDGPTSGFYGFLAGGLVMLPLVLLGITGAGDLKFMMAFGLVTGLDGILWTAVYSLFWGALIGVGQVLLAGRLQQLYANFQMITYRMRPTNTHKIPYTVAILLGWLTWIYSGGL
jgi:Flp pilus assembly protein protease CpaA